MPLRVPVSRASRNNVTYPTKPAAGADPDSRSDDQPENASKNLAVVDLPDAWNEEAQNRCYAWISHFASV